MKTTVQKSSEVGIRLRAPRGGRGPGSHVASFVHEILIRGSLRT